MKKEAKPKEAPNLTHLLNQCEAFIACKLGSVAELTRYLGCLQPEVSRWITQRLVQPGGEITLRLETWRKMKMAELNVAALDTKEAYSTEFQRINKEHSTCER